MDQLDDFLAHVEKHGLLTEEQLMAETAPKEPWEVTTNYGRADLTLHPLVREAYKVACLIERCGASPELTAASCAAFALCESLSDLARHFNELEALVEQFNDGHTPPDETGDADSADEGR